MMSTSLNTTTTRAKRILMVVASPSVSTTLGWPVGFWASEMTHPYYEFSEAGYRVDLASPNGGRVEIDALSDPRHESGYSAYDLISMGFLSTPGLASLLDQTLKLSEVNPDSYEAVVVCGGQSPMFTFRDNKILQSLLAKFYEAEKPVAALIDVRLKDGSYLIHGKTMTGFANVEEDEAERIVGKQVMPWRIQNAAFERGANYIQGGLWKALAVRDGRLITGQQQYSGAKVARLAIEALGV